jgi:uncharacterized membrane protein
MSRHCVALGLLFVLFLSIAPASAQEWENPREIYTGWDCASMQQGNPTYDLCKQCDAEGGTFLWKTPADATMFDEKLDEYEGRCESADSGQQDYDGDVDAAVGADVEFPEAEAEAECSDGMLRCPDGQCYAVDSVRACCSQGGSCSSGNICWSMSTGSLCCRFGETPTDRGCYDPGSSTWITRRPGFDPAATETASGPQEGAAPEAQPKAASPYVDLTLCNKTSGEISVAMGFRENPGDEYWTFRGWWNFGAGECKDFHFAKGYMYLHAEGDMGKWGSDKRFCVRSKKFSYLRDGTGDCSERIELFIEKLLETDTHRWNLTE